MLIHIKQIMITGHHSKGYNRPTDQTFDSIDDEPVDVF